MAVETYNQISEGVSLHNNIGTHSERSVARHCNAAHELPTASQPPAALSPGRGEPEFFSGPTPQAQSTGNTGAVATAFSPPILTPSLEAAQVTLRSRKVAGLARVAAVRRARFEYTTLGGRPVRIYPDGSTSLIGQEIDQYEGSFVLAAQQATGLVKGKTLPVDAVTVLLTQVVVHQAPKERSCRIPRLNVILALMGCADANGVAQDANRARALASRTERELARAILSLKLDGGDMKSRARHEAGVEVRALRTTKGGK